MTVLLPGSLDEALQAMASHPTALPVAGGTDLLVHWPQRPELHRQTFVDLSAVQELRPLRWTTDELVLGGLTTYWDVIEDGRVREEFPLLVEAARQIGSIQIQARGTWAGNIINGSPAADGVAALMAYDGVVVLDSTRGRSEIPLAEFYSGYKQMRRAPDELVTQIRLPRREYSVQIFEKVGSRRAQAIAKVGVTVTRSASGWRVVAHSVAPFVCRCTALERCLESEASVGSPDDLLPAIREDVSPIDDLRSSAAYRERVMARVLYYGLLEVCPSFH
ncbi:MAG: FAD binding domain-containing protein [Gemmatimonadota bacterium]|nr:MAG: FAD binding domain-containing protein [Gemmatimonadota bacterium]